jgi:hypothetical protein
MATLTGYKVCATERMGTGTIECFVETGIPNGFFLTTPDWSLDTETETFNKAYLTQQIQEGKIIPFTNSVSFTDNSEDDVFQTFDTGIKTIVRDGKPEFGYDYQRGYCWHAAAHSYNSFKAYKVILIWDNDVLGFAKDADGKTIKGLDMGYIKTANYKNNNGTESQTTTINFQLTNPKQYNQDMALLDSEQLDFNPSDINGVIDAKLTIEDQLVNADESFNLFVTAMCNTSINIEGLSVSNFELTGNTGFTINAVAYNSSENKYEIDLSAPLTTGDQIGIRLFGTTTVIDLSGVLYQGASKIQTVIA